MTTRETARLWLPAATFFPFVLFLISFASHALVGRVEAAQEDAQPGVLLLSAEQAVDGPYIVQTRFFAGDDAVSLKGVWLAGLAPDAAALPQVLSVAWTQGPADWFGPRWTLYIASAHGLLPQALNPAAGAGFLDGAQIVQLASAPPRPGRLYETTLSYDPENGLASVRIVDLTADQSILERGVQLAPYDQALAPAAGLAGAAGEIALAGGPRFEAFSYERGFIPWGIRWSVEQRASPTDSWSRPQTLDRRLETQADVRLPWDALPGRLVLRDMGDAGGALAEVQADARQLSIPIEIASFPAGEHRLALAYQSEHGVWDLLEERVVVGRLALKFEDLRVVTATGEEPHAQVSGTLSLESDGLVPGTALRLSADVATFDRDYWLASAVDGSVTRGALQIVPAATGLAIIDSLTLDVPATGASIPFAATLPLDGAAPPPAGGWRIDLRPEAVAPVPVVAPASESLWVRATEDAVDTVAAAGTADTDDTAEKRPGLTVMTYNIHHGQGMDDAVDLDRIASVIRSAQADVVGLNEVDRATARTGRIDQAAELARMLDMHLAYGANIHYEGGLYGNAILSRFPITSAANLALPGGSEQRGLLHVTLDVAGEELHLLATHLGLTGAERKLQLESIAQYVSGLEDPVILVGDFNMESGVESALSPRLRDSWRLQLEERRVRTPRTGSTFSSTRPSRRIDYILVSSGVRLRGDDPVRTISSLASDHLPVMAALELAP